MRKLKLLFISSLALWGAAIIFPESVMPTAGIRIKKPRTPEHLYRSLGRAY